MRRMHVCVHCGRVYACDSTCPGATCDVLRYCPVCREKKCGSCHRIVTPPEGIPAQQGLPPFCSEAHRQEYLQEVE